VSERTLGSNRFVNGSPFHTEGPTTENAPCGQLWKYRQKGQRIPPFHREEGIAVSGAHAGWENKDLAGRSEQGKTPPVLCSDAEYDPLLVARGVGLHLA